MYTRCVADADDLIFRAMLRDGLGRPSCGASARQLGVRPNVDTPVSPSGDVAPRTGGMSVTPGSPSLLPPHFRPTSLPGGQGKLPVFALAVAAVCPPLFLRPDPGSPHNHAFVEPSHPTPLSSFQQALCATGGSWQEVPS